MNKGTHFQHLTIEKVQSIAHKGIRVGNRIHAGNNLGRNLGISPIVYDQYSITGTLLPEQHTQKIRKPVKPQRPKRRIGMLGFSPEPGRVAGAYVRVSTEDQAKGGVSLEAQEARLKQYAEMANWQLFKVYVDAGLSAGSTARPAFQEMLEDARDGRINVILVYKLDRFSRSLKDIILTIDELKQLNVDFVSMTESIDTSTPIGKVMFHIIGAFAEFERDVIAQRTSMGMNQKAKKGHAEYRPPFGYVFVEGKLRVQEDDADVVRAIFRDRVSGMSLRRLERKYGIEFTSVRWILRNPIYIGLLRWKGELIPGKHQPIIDHETWDDVQSSWRKGRKASDA